MAFKDPNEPFTRVSVEEAQELMKQPNVAVIDVRNLDEWQKVGHVPNATLIPVDSIMARINEIPEDKDLIFICAGGVRSALAAEYAAAMGREQTMFNVEGGTNEWVAKGLPIEHD